MFVGKRMKIDVITVSPGDTLRRANDLLQVHRIHHLPVVEGERLVGIVTGTDIRRGALERTPPDEGGAGAAEDRKVSEIMTRGVITLSPMDTIEDAALILHRRRFGAIPVVENGRLVGILAKADIIATFLDTLNIEGIGVRVEVVLPREAGAMLRLIRQLGDMELEIRSMVLSLRGDDYIAFLRLSTIDVATVKEKLREAGFRVPEIAEFLE
jgi:acetoin utilization protein AcuB